MSQMEDAAVHAALLICDKAPDHTWWQKNYNNINNFKKIIRFISIQRFIHKQSSERFRLVFREQSVVGFLLLDYDVDARPT